MTLHTHSIVVDRPVTQVYGQWTQFESYPHFMENVEDVEQVSDELTHWRINVAGVEREYDAVILEQRPDNLIAWCSTDGPRQAGRVQFEPMDGATTRVTLELDFDPQGFTENVGEALGVVSGTAQDSLERFKEYVETDPAPTSGWRGTIRHGQAQSGSGGAGTSGMPSGSPNYPGPGAPLASSPLPDHDAG